MFSGHTRRMHTGAEGRSLPSRYQGATPEARLAPSRTHSHVGDQRDGGRAMPPGHLDSSRCPQGGGKPETAGGGAHHGVSPPSGTLSSLPQLV